MDKRKRWSPLTCLASAPLSPSGLVILQSHDGEVETLVRTNIELRYEGSTPLPRPPAASGPWIARDVHLTIHITTHRIVLIDQDATTAGSIPLAHILSANQIGGPSLRSPKASYKIQLATSSHGELHLVFKGVNNSYSKSQKDRDEAYKSISRALHRKAWEIRERTAIKEALRPSTAIASRKVGVDAIMTKNELRHRENAYLADAAFASSNTTQTMGFKQVGGGMADIDVFLGEASELIRVIEKYVATIERERASAAAISGGSSNKDGKDSSKDKDTARLVGMLENMGMTSALSAKQSGSTYHTQLARQLVDFLRYNDKLSQAGGMMTLTDVYCLFNRARGSNMISPEDLLKAVDIMKELKLGLSKRTFASGIVVLQDDAFDDESMARRLTDLAIESMRKQSSFNVGGITAMDASRSLKISALLANEHLLSAEQMGSICRDVTIEGVRFFPNLFESGDFTMLSKSCAGVEQALVHDEAGCYSVVVDSICSSLSRV